jgi:hypothetical protein
LLLSPHTPIPIGLDAIKYNLTFSIGIYTKSAFLLDTRDLQQRREIHSRLANLVLAFVRAGTRQFSYGPVGNDTSHRDDSEIFN